MRWRGNRLTVVVAAVVGCAVASGCGAEGGDRDARATGAAPPAIATPPEAVAQRIMRRLANAEVDRECRPIRAVNARSTYDFACPQLPEVQRSFSEFEVVDTAVYGTAAVVDYRTGGLPDGATMVMHVTPEGEWAFTHFGLLYQTVGTSDADNVAGFRRAVALYLRAIRTRDCSLFYKHAVTHSADEETACRRELPPTRPLAKGLAETPGVEPEYLGGNERFGFYGLTLGENRRTYRTVTVVKTDPGTLRPYLVLSAIPGPVPTARVDRR